MKRSAIYSLVIMLALFVSACSGGEEGGASMESGASESGAMMDDGVRTIEIIGLDDMRFAVASEEDGLNTGDQVGQNFVLEGITASPGEEIRITLTTQSQLPAVAMSHNFVLLAMGTDSDAFATASATAQPNGYIAPDMEDSILAQTEMLGGGESDTITFTVPDEPGEYTFICSFPGHYLSGMRGVLIVE